MIDALICPNVIVAILSNKHLWVPTFLIQPLHTPGVGGFFFGESFQDEQPQSYKSV